ncbi:MAG: TonB family protein, partial [Bacteroidales bacterium]|nr:TonB family protein [Bacteroidales bacterium]
IYRLTLGRDRWFQLSRLYIFSALVFGLVFPLVRLPMASLPGGMRLTVLDEVVVGSPLVAASPDASQCEVFPLISIVYLLGLAVSLILLLLSVGRVVIRLHKMNYERQGDLKLTLLDDDTLPFSFFNRVIVGTKSMSEEDLQSVLAHEGEHVRQRHSVDLISVRLICSVAWFNPFAWLLLRELKAVHEYQADAATVESVDRKNYFRLLFRQATGVGYVHITNKFITNNIKKRIIMMKKTKSRFGAWKMLAALPVAVLMIAVGCNPNEEAAATNSQEVSAAVTADQPSIEPVIYDTKPDPSVLDEAPEFPGGSEGLRAYLIDNLRYPEQAKKDGVEGMVVVLFTVAEDGSILNVEVSRGIGSGCDEEAVRVVKAMPKWKPAVKDGKPAAGQYALPISFKLR